ncbi:uncharacterized protein LOC123658673 [Melitaea cinxia]|uniref:uncharacterized protein LOC123658673 n=1 Tax=Melitaea cinxia TaxID=113334 RepID=UPI001E2731AF|nr:uncharacterized protein LOC123658673 [Melitaea cinxia]
MPDGIKLEILCEQDIFERDLILDELKRILQLATTNDQQFRSRASDLNSHQRKFNKIQSKIEKTLIKHKLFDKDEHIKIRNDFNDVYYAIISYVNSFKNDDLNRRRSLHQDDICHKRNLPVLPLPEFNGDPTDWQSFFDLFCSLVHDNRAYTETEKLRYLLLSVKNEPYNLIKSLPITGDNYIIALKILKYRYENRRIIASKHLDRILDLETCSERSYHSVRNLLNVYQENIRALEVMDFPIDQWSFILLNILLRKIPISLRKNYERSLSRPSDIPDVNTLIEFLEREISADEIAIASYTQSTKNYPQHINNHRTKIGGKSNAIHRNSFNASVASITEQTGPYVNSNRDRSCLKCSGQHLISKCTEFLNLSPQDRYNFIKNKNICYNCLNVGHDVKNCKSKFVCRTCQKKHHSLIHLISPQSLAIVNKTATASAVSLPLTEDKQDDRVHNNYATKMHSSHSMVTVLLSTALIDLYLGNNKISSVRCIVDSGSQASFISEACVQRLGLPRTNVHIPVLGIGDTEPLMPRGMVTCAITPKNKHHPVIPVDALILPKLMSKMPNLSLPYTKWPHLKGLTLADPHFHTPQPVEMLLGADILSHILLNNTITGPPGTPIAMNSVFGYLLLGKLTFNTNISTPLQVCYSSFDNDNLQRFWELESVPEKRSYTPDEELCESFFRRTHNRDLTGRYVVALPFKVNAPPLGESRQIAVARFHKLEYRLERNPQLKIDYHACLQEYIDLNHMELVDDKPSVGASYYIPHHCVIKPSSQTTRTRVVFDAGCRTTSGYSLNDVLFSGPKLHLDIVDVLLKFRVYRVAFCSDIKQMFRNILLRESDRDFQRILWRRSPEEPLRDYRLRTVTFGVNCSPYLALRTIRQLACDEGERLKLAAAVLLNNVFVDDVITGADSEAQALLLQQELIAICATAGFELRKWHSNSQAVLAAVQPSEFHGERCESVLFSEMEGDKGVNVLGLQWNPRADSFSFKVHVTSREYTKRAILSEIAKIYDPLGLLSPITLFAKHLIQLMWLANIGWDEPPPIDILNSWTYFTKERPLLASISFPRYIFNTDDLESIQIHGFSDASQVGYAACVYIRHVGKSGDCETHLIMAKTRVAPLRVCLTIPRLELMAALLLSKLIEKVNHVYGDKIRSGHIVAWSDSSVVLAWLRSSPHEWKTFVSNRVSEILTRVPASCWRHVPSADNPADAASRGLLPAALVKSDLWYHGPVWLQQSSDSWPIQ